ncbi:hypothetical protein BH11CYA1_BH11CYA1_46870 [soil metagenome]
MSIFTTLSPKTADGRRVAVALSVLAVIEVLVFLLQAQLLFSDVRLSIVIDLFQIFSLPLISLAFCLQANRKEQLAAICVSLIFYLLATLLCSGKIHAKIWRFQHPGKYNPVILEQASVKGKTIRTYLIRDQKYPAILVAKVEPLSEQIALYWPLVKFGHTNNASLVVYKDSIVVTGQGDTIFNRMVVPFSAIP